MMRTLFFRPVTTLAFAAAYTVTHAQVWTQKADHLDCRYDGVTFSIGDNVYYGSGITCAGTHSNTFRKFDPVANAWTAIASLPGSTRRMASSFAINGKGYVVGGIAQSGFALNDVWEYDPIANAWTQKNNFSGPPRGSTADFAVNGKGYICGGVANPNTYFDLWEYDPMADAWTQRANFGGSWIFQASGFSIGGNGYVVFGRDDFGVAVNELWQFDPVANTWSQKADFPGVGRTDAAAFAINDVGYAGFGGDGTSYYGDFYSYSAATDQWTAVSGIPSVPAYYDGWAATGTAGYCVMQIASNYQNDTWEFIPSGSAAVEEVQSASPFNVLASGPGEVTVVSGTASGVLQVLGTDGRLIQQLRTAPQERTTIGLPAGCYLFTMGGSNGTQRVVVME